MLAPRPPETRCPQHEKAFGHGHAIMRARHEARLLLAHEPVVAPVSAFRLHSLQAIEGQSVVLNGMALHAPGLAELSGRITWVAAAVCTLGLALDEQISALFRERKPLLAVALDSLTTEMLFRLSDQLYARVKREARRRGLQAGPPENPGDAGLALDAQASVLDLAGIDTQIVSANDHGMLRPVKSLSFVAALGPHLPAETFLPRCVRCASREGCRLRTQ